MEYIERFLACVFGVGGDVIELDIMMALFIACVLTGLLQLIWIFHYDAGDHSLDDGGLV